ncbi:hypothetical protein CMO84_04650 [Candidatus Woesearchaeota archaeon]|nr:hypothetical protein [Candidatus Woesearchaeota archaeon]
MEAQPRPAITWVVAGRLVDGSWVGVWTWPDDRKLCRSDLCETWLPPRKAISRWAFFGDDPGDSIPSPDSILVFQFWHRAPLASGVGSNFSDALEVRFCN